MSSGQKKIVILGMMSRMPVAGVIWQTVQYLVGFERLGYEVYYVEAHGCTPTAFMAGEQEDGSARAAAFIAGVLRSFDLGDRWAYQAVHGNGQSHGMTRGQLLDLYRSAALIINLHGGTVPLPEHAATGRLVYLETDPVQVQMELHQQLRQAIDFLEPHAAFFTFGENYGKTDCRLPVADRFRFRPTRQPVVLDFWQGNPLPPGPAFTTIGNWRQLHREIPFNGQVYHWSKHYEFLKFLDLPEQTNQSFELALAGYEDADRRLLESKGWQVRPATALSTETGAYRNYIRRSRGEFTVAKDQNVRLRTGWFSDRSASYLASGRPVVTQDTGFGSNVPVGEGLFAFTTLDEAAGAVDEINADYQRHCRAAADLARDYFSHEIVLGRLLSDVGL
jgi:hypothetical protein